MQMPVYRFAQQLYLLIIALLPASITMSTQDNNACTAFLSLPALKIRITLAL